MLKISKEKIFFAILIFIGTILGIFYYYFIRGYGKFYFVDYYDYYLRIIVLSHYLKTLDFTSFFYYFYTSLIDRLVLIRSLPFFLLFKPSHFLFSYSNFIFNYLLLLMLFKVLSKIISYVKSFLFCLFILSWSFFLESLGSFQIYLSYFLICSMFFIYLYLLNNHPKKYFWHLTTLFFLLFLTKNTSYLLAPIIVTLLIVYFIFKKKHSLDYITTLLLSSFIGFMIYFTVILKFNLAEDLDSLTGNFVALQGYNSISDLIIKSIAYIINNKLFYNINFFLKFESILLSFILYFIVIYYFFKKKHNFWIMMFIFSEIFLIFFFNIMGAGYELRYFIPFYFIYLFLIFNCLLDISKFLLKKNYYLIILSICLLLFTINFIDLKNLSNNKYVWHAKNNNVIQFLNISLTIPSNSFYFVNEGCGSQLFYILYSFIDYDKSNNYSSLSFLDKRFNYIIKEFKNESLINSNEYILTSNYKIFNNSNYELHKKYFSQDCSMFLIKKIRNNSHSPL